MIKLSKLINDFKEVIQYYKDKYWFYYVIDGDEFHSSLSLNLEKCMKSDKHYMKELQRISRDRARAHRLDVIFNKLGGDELL